MITKQNRHHLEKAMALIKEFEDLFEGNCGYPFLRLYSDLSGRVVAPHFDGTKEVNKELFSFSDPKELVEKMKGLVQEERGKQRNQESIPQKQIILQDLLDWIGSLGDDAHSSIHLYGDGSGEVIDSDGEPQIDDDFWIESLQGQIRGFLRGQKQAK